MRASIHFLTTGRDRESTTPLPSSADIQASRRSSAVQLRAFGPPDGPQPAGYTPNSSNRGGRSVKSKYGASLGTDGEGTYDGMSSSHPSQHPSHQYPASSSARTVTLQTPGQSTMGRQSSANRQTSGVGQDTGERRGLTNVGSTVSSEISGALLTSKMWSVAKGPTSSIFELSEGYSTVSL